MTEFEKKLLLTKDEYDYLMELFGYESPLVQKPNFKQINYYFDTDDFSMNRQNITCRIRLKNGTYKGTMKQHSPDSDHSTETEIEVYDGLNNNAFINMGLRLQGALVTERCAILKTADCEVVLDKNDYLGHTDYELEIEYTLEHEKNAQAILRIFRDMLTQRKCFFAYKEGLLDLPHFPSKSNRFFKRKSVVNQASQKGKPEHHAMHSIAAKEHPQPPDSASFHKEPDVCYYSDPDDYMSDYLGSMMPDESKHLS